MLAIPKRVVKEFLNRKLKNYDRWKKLTKLDLEEYCDDLPIRPPIWSKLKKHQKVCFLIGARTKRFAFWLDTGTGKTLLSISLIRYFRALGETNRVLVLVPNRINKEEWAREIEQHSPKTEYEILSGLSADKWEQLENTSAQIIITTYAGLVRMCCKKVKKKKGKGSVLKPHPPKVKRVLKFVQGLVLDESTAVKNKKSLAYRICLHLSKHVSVFYPLSGTPFGRDPTDLWSQMYLVDFGDTLGPNLGMFRAAFFKAKKNPFSGFPEYKFDKKKKKMLHRFLANRSIVYEADGADLPKMIPVVKEVKLPQTADAYLKRSKEVLNQARGNFTEMKSAFIRMRQISSGFLGYKDDDTGAKAQIEFKPNPKLDMLMSIVDEIVDNHKVVIFHEYIYSGDRIAEELKELGIKFARIYGGTSDKEAPKQLRMFVNDDKCRVFVVNSAAGSYGLNLQIAKYAIYYESPVSPIIRYQTQRRVERQHSKHDKVFVYDLVAKDTYDNKILANLKEGRDLWDDIIKGVKR